MLSRLSHTHGVSVISTEGVNQILDSATNEEFVTFLPFSAQLCSFTWIRLNTNKILQDI